MIRSNQAGQAKNRPPRREEGENGNLQRFPKDLCITSGFPRVGRFGKLAGKSLG
ncbi:hypothetical protein [Profundibacter sp.]|uniref:hypothetical protein n=1 Tax=Profundibacter sp. TaxID=3101071 RepID=UPI003D11169D